VTRVMLMLMLSSVILIIYCGSVSRRMWVLLSLISKRLKVGRWLLLFGEFFFG